MSIAQKIASGFNTNGVLVGANEYIYTRKRNLLRNGDMALAQYNTGTKTGINTAGRWCCDGWAYNTSTAGHVSMLQSDDAPLKLVSDFASCLRIDVTTADASVAASDYSHFTQSLIAREAGYRIAHGTSRAKPLTLSFWVKATKTGTNIAELHNVDNTRYCSQAYTISSANTWEYKTVTFPADTGGSVTPNDTGEHFRVNFWIIAGSTYSGGTLGTTWHTTVANRAVGQVNHMDSTANDFQFTGVQLEIGTVATPFEHMLRGDSLEECKLYYQKSYKYSNVAGTVTNDGAIYTDRVTEAITSRTGLHHRFSPQMVLTPTLTLYALDGTTDGSGNSGHISDCQTNFDHNTACDIASVDVNGAGFNQVVSDVSFDDVAACHFVADVGF